MLLVTSRIKSILLDNIALNQEIPPFFEFLINLFIASQQVSNNNDNKSRRH